MLMKAMLAAWALGCATCAATAAETFPLPCDRYVSPAMTDEYRAQTLAECEAEKARAPEPDKHPPAPPEKVATPKPKLALPKDLAAWGQAVRRRVVQDLKDPESARFRGLYVSAWNDHGVMKPLLCGEVNAKNSYGGYTGFSRFMADENGTVFDPGSDGWESSCGWRLKAIGTPAPSTPAQPTRK